MNPVRWLQSKKIMCTSLARLCLAIIIVLGATFFVDAKEEFIEKPSIPSIDETMKMMDIMHDHLENEALREVRRRVDWAFVGLFFVLLFTGFGLRMRDSRNDSTPGKSRLAYSAAAMLLCIYIGIGVYYDLLMGETSSYGRGGAHIVASDGTLMFWMIVIAKLAAVIVSACVGVGILKRRSE